MSSQSTLEVANQFSPEFGNGSHVYSICFFERGFIVPEVSIIAADSDAEAVAEARTRRLFTTREVWDRHRLVTLIPASK